MTAHGKRGSRLPSIPSHSVPFHSLASELARRRRRSRESDGFIREGAVIWPEKEESFLRSPLPSPASARARSFIAASPSSDRSLIALFHRNKK